MGDLDVFFDLLKKFKSCSFDIDNDGNWIYVYGGQRYVIYSTKNYTAKDVDTSNLFKKTGDTITGNIQHILGNHYYLCANDQNDTINDLRISGSLGSFIFERCTGASTSKGGGIWEVISFGGSDPDAIHKNGNSEIIGLTDDAVPDDTDVFLGEKLVGLLWTKVKLSLITLWLFFKGKADLLYQPLSNSLQNNVTHHVNPDTGSDSNSGDETHPFATIQHAIDLIPKNLNGFTANIILQESLNYVQTAVITNYYGGSLVVSGINNDSSGVLVVNVDPVAFYIENCTANITLQKFRSKALGGGTQSILLNNCSWIYLNRLKFSEFIGSDSYGIYAINSNLLCSGVYDDILDDDAQQTTTGISSDSSVIYLIANQGQTNQFGSTNYFYINGGLIFLENGTMTPEFYAKVADRFPGFGTTNATAAYGNHDHSGIYQPANADIVIDASYVHTDNNFTTAIKNLVSKVKVSMIGVSDIDIVSVGDAKWTWRVPSELNGLSLSNVQASVITTSASAVATCQIRNSTTAHDMLSTPITIDATKYTSNSSSVPPVVDETYKIVSTDDLLAFDVDSVAANIKGLQITLTFN